MTVAIGFANGTQVWMGCDKQASGGTDKQIITNSKVFANNGLMFGICDSLRMQSLLQWELVVPEHPKTMSKDQYIGSLVVTAIRETMLAHGAMEYNNESRESGHDILVGYRGELFRIMPNFATIRPERQYDAIGAGEAYAVTAMFCFMLHDPMMRLHLSLNACAKLCSFISQENAIYSMKQKRMTTWR